LPPAFGLVFCDGPKAHNREGLPRYGLLPLLSGRLSEECRILLDDADRVSESQILHLWREEYCLEVAQNYAKHAPFAILRKPSR
jgi:hypothetical protein